MKLTDICREFGLPSSVGYYSIELAKKLGISEAILLSYLLRLVAQGRFEDPVSRFPAEVAEATGLNRRQLLTARAALRKRGLVHETWIGRGHRTGFRIDLDALRALAVEGSEDLPSPEGSRDPRDLPSPEGSRDPRDPDRAIRATQIARSARPPKEEPATTARSDTTTTGGGDELTRINVEELVHHLRGNGLSDNALDEAKEALQLEISAGTAARMTSPAAWLKSAATNAQKRIDDAEARERRERENQERIRATSRCEHGELFSACEECRGNREINLERARRAREAIER